MIIGIDFSQNQCPIYCFPWKLVHFAGSHSQQLLLCMGFSGMFLSWRGWIIHKDSAFSCPVYTYTGLPMLPGSWVYECLTTTQTQLYVLQLQSTIQAEHANKIIQDELLKSFHQKTKSKKFSYTLAQGIGDFANCCISRGEALSQHLHEASVHREISLGFPSNKNSMFRLCKIWVWRSGYSIQKYLWAEGWQQQMSDQGRRGHASTAQSSGGLLGALTNALKYLEDNNEITGSLCYTHTSD